MSDEMRADPPMCPLLTCAAGKSRPCARARCEWWVESFDARYSSCAVLSIASATHKTMGIQKAIVRGIAQGGVSEMRVSDRITEIVQDLECRHQGTDISINGRALADALRDVAERARVEEGVMSSYRDALNGVCERLMLDDIADQIEREQGGRVSRMRVLAVVTEMERHVSGVEGAEDSPVARWARELRAALGGDRRDRAADVSVSAYDLLPQEERDAIAWVREHGWLEEVEAHWSGRVPLTSVKRMVALHKAKRERLKAHALGLERKCAERGETIRELSGKAAKQSDEIRVMRDVIVETCARLGVEGTGSTVDDAQVIWREISRRLMPEGMEWLVEEWPRFEDNEPVRFDDAFLDHQGTVRSVLRVEMWQEGGFTLHTGQGTEDWHSAGERVKRPAVLASDGVPLEVRQTVYGIGRSQHEFEVLALNDVNPEVGDRFNVKCFDKDENEECWCDPRLLTHTKPEPPDSAERIADEIDRLREEVALHLGDYLYDEDGNDSIQFSMELVAKRCRKLAERERGE